MIETTSRARLALGLSLLAGTMALVACGPAPSSRTTTSEQTTTTTPMVMPTTTTTTTIQQSTQRP